MTNRGTSTRQQRRAITRILLAQTLFTVTLGGLCWWLKSPAWGYSALLGGLIYLVPSLYQAKQVLTHNHSNNIRATLRELYKSEIWKMALTAVLFGVVFTLVKPIEPFPLFGVFIVMQLIAWLAPIVQNQQFFRT
ncbi:MAG TPA: ATP synthase subunit I [Motiliproteus sp.]